MSAEEKFPPKSPLSATPEKVEVEFALSPAIARIEEDLSYVEEVFGNPHAEPLASITEEPLKEIVKHSLSLARLVFATPAALAKLDPESITEIAVTSLEHMHLVLSEPRLYRQLTWTHYTYIARQVKDYPGASPKTIVEYWVKNANPKNSWEGMSFFNSIAEIDAAHLKVAFEKTDKWTAHFLLYLAQKSPEHRQLVLDHPPHFPSQYRMSPFSSKYFSWDEIFPEADAEAALELFLPSLIAQGLLKGNIEAVSKRLKQLAGDNLSVKAVFLQHEQTRGFFAEPPFRPYESKRVVDVKNDKPFDLHYTLSGVEEVLPASIVDKIKYDAQFAEEVFRNPDRAPASSLINLQLVEIAKHSIRLATLVCTSSFEKLCSDDVAEIAGSSLDHARLFFKIPKFFNLKQAEYYVRILQKNKNNMEFAELTLQHLEDMNVLQNLMNPYSLYVEISHISVAHAKLVFANVKQIMTITNWSLISIAHRSQEYLRLILSHLSSIQTQKPTFPAMLVENTLLGYFFSALQDVPEAFELLLPHFIARGLLEGEGVEVSQRLKDLAGDNPKFTELLAKQTRGFLSDPPYRTVVQEEKPLPRPIFMRRLKNDIKYAHGILQKPNEEPALSLTSEELVSIAVQTPDLFQRIIKNDSLRKKLGLKGISAIARVDVEYAKKILSVPKYLQMFQEKKNGNFWIRDIAAASTAHAEFILDHHSNRNLCSILSGEDIVKLAQENLGIVLLVIRFEILRDYTTSDSSLTKGIVEIAAASVQHAMLFLESQELCELLRPADILHLAFKDISLARKILSTEYIFRELERITELPPWISSLLLGKFFTDNGSSVNVQHLRLILGIPSVIASLSSHTIVSIARKNVEHAKFIFSRSDIFQKLSNTDLITLAVAYGSIEHARVIFSKPELVARLKRHPFNFKRSYSTHDYRRFILHNFHYFAENFSEKDFSDKFYLDELCVALRESPEPLTRFLPCLLERGLLGAVKKDSTKTQSTVVVRPAERKSPAEISHVETETALARLEQLAGSNLSVKRLFFRHTKIYELIYAQGKDYFLKFFNAEVLNSDPDMQLAFILHADAAYVAEFLKQYQNYLKTKFTDIRSLHIFLTSILDGPFAMEAWRVQLESLKQESDANTFSQMIITALAVLLRREKDASPLANSDFCMQFICYAFQECNVSQKSEFYKELLFFMGSMGTLAQHQALWLDGVILDDAEIWKTDYINTLLARPDTDPEKMPIIKFLLAEGWDDAKLWAAYRKGFLQMPWAREWNELPSIDLSAHDFSICSKAAMGKVAQGTSLSEDTMNIVSLYSDWEDAVSILPAQKTAVKVIENEEGSEGEVPAESSEEEAQPEQTSPEEKASPKREEIRSRHMAQMYCLELIRSVMEAIYSYEQSRQDEDYKIEPLIYSTTSLSGGLFYGCIEAFLLECQTEIFSHQMPVQIKEKRKDVVKKVMDLSFKPNFFAAQSEHAKLVIQKTHEYILKDISNPGPAELELAKAVVKRMDKIYASQLHIYNSPQVNTDIKEKYIQRVELFVKTFNFSARVQAALYALAQSSYTAQYRQFHCNSNLTRTSVLFFQKHTEARAEAIRLANEALKADPWSVPESKAFNPAPR